MSYYNRDPKRDHNFDNHPFLDFGAQCWVHLYTWILRVVVACQYALDQRDANGDGDDVRDIWW